MGRCWHFNLAGINNQNFIMRDEETGSWWQQVTGEAIFGPLAGGALARVALLDDYWFDWKTYNPNTQVYL